jgi:hypothetical protein
MLDVIHLYLSDLLVAARLFCGRDDPAGWLELRDGPRQGDLYIAPNALPDPPGVTLTAISEADHIASASITVNLIEAKYRK